MSPMDIIRAFDILEGNEIEQFSSLPYEKGSRFHKCGKEFFPYRP
jgi:hypothetical protein